MPSVDQMREFVCLAETKSFTAVAKRFYMSQPAVSKRVQRLEEELGSKLLDRGPKSFELTEAGRLACETFSRMLDEYDQLGRSLEALSREASGVLTVGVLYYGVEELTNPFVREYKARYPHVKVRYVSCQGYQVLEHLLAGDIDLGIIVLPNGKRDNRFACTFIQEVAERCVVSAESPLAKLPSVSKEDLADYTVVYLSDEGMDAETSIHDTGCRDAVDAEQIDMVAAMLENNPRTFWISDDIIEGKLSANLAFVPVSEPIFGLSYYYARRINDDNPLVSLFEKTVSDLQR